MTAPSLAGAGEGDIAGGGDGRSGAQNAPAKKMTVSPLVFSL